MIYEHYSIPHISWDWYIAELNPEEDLAFGYTYTGILPEASGWGIIDMAKLKQIELKIGVRQLLAVVPLRPRKDPDWRPTKAGLISKIRESSRNRKP